MKIAKVTKTLHKLLLVVLIACIALPMDLIEKDHSDKLKFMGEIRLNEIASPSNFRLN